MPTDRVSTSCERELKKQMILQDIPFAEALNLGGTFLTKCNLGEREEIMEEKKSIRKEIRVLSNQLNYLDKRLKELEEIKAKEDPKLKEKERMARGLRANNPLRDV